MKIKKLVFGIIGIGMVTAGILVWSGREHTEYVEAMEESKVQAAYELLAAATGSETMYTDFIRINTLVSGTGEGTAEPSDGTREKEDGILCSEINYEESVHYQIEVNEEGCYYLQLAYKPMSNTLSDFNVAIKINGEQPYVEMKTIVLPLNWKDVTKEYPVDSYGDEMAPEQIRIDGWRTTYLYNNTYSTSLPLLVPLNKGSNEITITNVSSDGLGLGTLSYLEPDLGIEPYSEYRNEVSGELIDTLKIINATEYVEKNTTQAIYKSENNPVLTPHNPNYKKLNTLSWTESGAKITYEFKVEQTGYYRLALHYKNQKEEFDAFESIYIDQAIPFEECVNYSFPATGSTWANEVITDEEGMAYEFYLTEGTHTISLRAESELIDEAWRYARLISEHVAQFALQITKITGSEKDNNRTWKMTQYISEIPDYLKAYETLIQQIKFLLQQYSVNGTNGALVSDLDKALQFIEKVSEYPDEIALYTEDLTGRDNSILVSLSNFTSKIRQQNFTLDNIYVYGNENLPKATTGVLSSIKNWVVTLAGSFTSEKYKTVAEDEEVVTIWVNRALTHVDLLQKLADTDFTTSTGIKVKITTMPDANRLTMASAADETPDIALGLASHMPFDLACRGALYDMTQFEDFWQVANRFSAGSFVSYVYNEGIYAIPETLDFRALVYRTDIFESLGLTPPDTWQKVIDMLPELQRYGMNFYHNISSGVGYKWFYQTTPFIFQNNGKLYSDDGMTTAIDEPNSVKGLKALGDLFISYSVDTQVNSFFNSFRYSLLPVGIIDSSDYILLKNGAPELEGQWALSNYPGTVQEDGAISRWYVANGTGATIFKDSEHIQEAWEFLKWWTDHETQVNYTYTLRSTYGKQFFWLPSNLEALKDTPIEQADKEVIIEQVTWLRDVPRTPGQYLLERSISDIWNTMVFDGISAQVAIDEKTIAINREIRKKMQELGYYDSEGNVIKKYVIRDVDWIQEQMEQKGGQ